MAKSFLELKKKYQDLETDRNNVLTQTKILLAEKITYDEIKQTSEELEKTNKTLFEQKDKLHQEGEKLRGERDMLAENYSQLKVSFQDVSRKRKLLESEARHLRGELQKTVEANPRYQKLDTENKTSQSENKSLKESVKSLTDKLKKANERLKKIAGRDINVSRQIQGYRQNLKHLDDERNRLAATNKNMNQSVQEAPRRFREMADQNKTLLKETAEMHYNLGVFYTENKNYSLAVKEFNRALDFNPDNAKVHYNLGYLYSEELDKHEEAMAHFQRYLEIDPNSKESNEVRGYMTVRQVYGDKMAGTK